MSREQWDRVWTTLTPNFEVALDCTPDDDLDLSWDETGEVLEQIESGEWGHYTFRAQVLERATGAELGVAYLGGCIYADPAEFVDHRACGRSNRELEAKGETGRCGSYFTGMVAEAIAEARKAYSVPRAYLRGVS